MKPVEAFIFDIGNVLVQFDVSRAERALAAHGLALPERAEWQQVAHRYERGALDRDTFLVELRELLGFRGEEEFLRRAWQEIFEPNVPVWDLVDHLHGRYPLFLLSNTNDLHHEYLAEEYAVFEKFSDGVFSYRAGLLKPEAGIFSLAIAQFGVDPAATVYLDDLGPNVEAARSAGLRAFRYDLGNHGALLDFLHTQGVQCV